MKKKIRDIVLFVLVVMILFITWLVFLIIAKNKKNMQNLNGLPDSEIVEIVTYDEEEMIDGVDGEEIIGEEEDSVDEFQITSDLKKVIQDVPFTSQAPQAQWDIQMFQDACEEASMIMAMKWVQGNMSLTPTEARDKIIEISNFEQEHYGFHLDVSIQDVEKVFHDYYGYNNIELKAVTRKEDLIEPLYDGNLIIIPTNGKVLNNPNFSDGGPERHMLVILGYDPVKNEFITNDPGTRRGEGYRYKGGLLFGAVRNYTSGYHQPIIGNQKLMLIIKKRK